MTTRERGAGRRAATIAAAALAVGCAATEPPTMPDSSIAERNRLAADADAWHAGRLERLRAPDGWLTLVGLAWLDEGVNACGRDASCAVAHDGFPAAELGAFVVADGAVRFEPSAPGLVEGVPDGGVLATDRDGPATVLRAGSCRMHVLDRAGRLAVRVRDEAAPLRAHPPRVERWPYDPAWRIVAELAPAQETMSVMLRIGVETRETAVGIARFRRDGASVALRLQAGSAPDRFFVVFGDATNGAETYGAGRFLEAWRDPDDPSRVVLDFNRAYSPPCAFTPYATCPLPVPENRLPFPVRAGETAPDLAP